MQENPSKAENMTVKALLTTREVIATYSMQDLTIELMVTLPANHPLGPIEVDNRKKVAVGTSQWRQWTLMLTTFLTHQVIITSTDLLMCNESVWLLGWIV